MELHTISTPLNQTVAELLNDICGLGLNLIRLIIQRSFERDTSACTTAIHSQSGHISQKFFSASSGFLLADVDMVDINSRDELHIESRVFDAPPTRIFNSVLKKTTITATYDLKSLQAWGPLDGNHYFRFIELPEASQRILIVDLDEALLGSMFALFPNATRLARKTPGLKQNAQHQQQYTRLQTVRRFALPSAGPAFRE